MVGDWTVQGIEPPTRAPRVGRIVHLVRAQPQPIPPVLVAGGCGGAGTTTTALGIASAMASWIRTVAVDASVATADLAVRGGDQRLAPASMQSWLSISKVSPAPIPLISALSQASSGAAVLGRDDRPLPGRATIATVCERLRVEGLLPIVDGGGSPLARHLRPLLDQPDIRLVLTIPARYDAANRIRIVLAGLDTEFGDELLASTVLVISHQRPESKPLAAIFAAHYEGWIGHVFDVPFDAHLANGSTIVHAALNEQTQLAYRKLAAAVLPELGTVHQQVGAHG